MAIGIGIFPKKNYKYFVADTTITPNCFISVIFDQDPGPAMGQGTVQHIQKHPGVGFTVFLSSIVFNDTRFEYNVINPGDIGSLSHEISGNLTISGDLHVLGTEYEHNREIVIGDQTITGTLSVTGDSHLGNLYVSDTIYGATAGSAPNIQFDNSLTTLDSDNVQDALVEISSRTDTICADYIQGDINTLVSANSYTNLACSNLINYIDTNLSSTSGDLLNWINLRDSQVQQNAYTYTDNACSNLINYLGNDSHSYTDTACANLITYVDNQDSSILSQAESYTDTACANVIQYSTAYTNAASADLLLKIQGQNELSEILANGNIAGAYEIDMNENKIVNVDTPTVSGDAANKYYVDNQISGVGSLSGVLAQGNSAGAYSIDMNSNKIQNVDTPTSSGDAANKYYVDSQDEIVSGDLITYTDSKDLEASGNLINYINLRDQIILSEAEAYTDTACSNLIAYIDVASGNLVNYINVQDSLVLSEAESYTDTACSDLIAYIDSKDAETLISANQYTDSTSGELQNTINNLSLQSITSVGATSNQTITLTNTGTGLIIDGDLIVRGTTIEYNTITYTETVSGNEIIVGDLSVDGVATFNGTTVYTKTPTVSSELTNKYYVDSQDISILSQAESYTDTACANLIEYINNQDASILSQAETYTDTACANLIQYMDVQIIDIAEAYTDQASSNLIDYINQEVALANSFTNSASANAYELSKTYTEEACSNLIEYMDTNIIAIANAYTDTACSNLISYIDTRDLEVSGNIIHYADTVILNDAKQYTDTASGNLVNYVDSVNSATIIFINAQDLEVSGNLIVYVNQQGAIVLAQAEQYTDTASGNLVNYINEQIQNNNELSEILANGNIAGIYEIDMNNNKIINTATCTLSGDVANKYYVDAQDTNLTNTIDLQTVTNNGSVTTNSIVVCGDLTTQNITNTANVYIDGDLHVAGLTYITVTDAVSGQIQYQNLLVIHNTQLGTSPADHVLISGTAFTTGDMNIGGNAQVGGQLNMTVGRIINVLDPTGAQDAATKYYVDTLVATASAASSLWLENTTDDYVYPKNSNHIFLPANSIFYMGADLLTYMGYGSFTGLLEISSSHDIKIATTDNFDITLETGKNAGTGISGDVFIRSKDATLGGTAGKIEIQTGAAQNGNSGLINLFTKNSAGANSGGINVYTGSAYVSGGDIRLNTGIGEFNGEVKFQDLVTVDRAGAITIGANRDFKIFKDSNRSYIEAGHHDGLWLANSHNSMDAYFGIYWNPLYSTWINIMEAGLCPDSAALWITQTGEFWMRDIRTWHNISSPYPGVGFIPLSLSHTGGAIAPYDPGLNDPTDGTWNSFFPEPARSILDALNYIATNTIHVTGSSVTAEYSSSFDIVNSPNEFWGMEVSSGWTGFWGGTEGDSVINIENTGDVVLGTDSPIDINVPNIIISTGNAASSSGPINSGNININTGTGASSGLDGVINLQSLVAIDREGNISLGDNQKLYLSTSKTSYLYHNPSYVIGVSPMWYITNNEDTFALGSNVTNSYSGIWGGTNSALTQGQIDVSNLGNIRLFTIKGESGDATDIDIYTAHGFINGNGGNINLTTGCAAGSGVHGEIIFQNTVTIDISGNLNMSNHMIGNVATPIASGDAANKYYVDSIVTGGSGLLVTEAPIDGNQYARQDGAWTVVAASSGGGIPEAPIDGNTYGRKDATWTIVTSGGSGGGGDALFNFPAGAWDYPISNPAQLDTDTGTYGSIKRNLFDDTTEEFIESLFEIPANVDSAGTVTFDAVGYAITAASSGNIALTVYHSMPSGGQSWDIPYSTKVSGDLLTNETQNYLDYFTWTETVANLGWLASDIVKIKLSRTQPSVNNLTGDWGLVHFRISIPRI